MSTIRPVRPSAPQPLQPARQRGLYSEYMGKSSLQSQAQASNGPNEERSATMQSAPRARGFKATESALRKDSPVLAQQPKRSRLEPKVLVPFEPRAGKAPRRIEIERKKRLYANQDVMSLLREGGIDYARYGLQTDHSSGKASYLPLEIFDDTEFECREPMAWVELGTDEQGNVRVPAQALRFDPSTPGQGQEQEEEEKTADPSPRGTAGGSFVACVATDYNSTTNKFTVKYSDTGAVAELARVHVCFEAEDPFTFSERVVNAHNARRTFEATIRYSLYIDSMPTDEISPLDSEQVHRILLLALNTKRLKQGLDTMSLVSEVNIDFARAMNKIIFDVNLKDPTQQELKEMLQLPDAEPVLEASYSGVVAVPKHDFPKHFSDFCFHSFYTKLEAISALVKVNAECQKLDTMKIFHTNINKAVRLDEFAQLQESAMINAASFLKDKWTQQLTQCIKTTMREVGKGWLNLQEKNREVYNFSKLKKFMVLVNFLMQDSLRYLIEQSAHTFSDFLFRHARHKVTVESTVEASVELVLDDRGKTRSMAANAKHNYDASAKTEGHDSKEPAPASQRAHENTLFQVDLVLKDGNTLEYSTEPAQMASQPLRLFEKALGLMHTIPQLETQVMSHLFWHGNQSRLGSVTGDEPWVVQMSKDLEARLEAATQPLQSYLKQYEKFEELIALDVDEYVAAFSTAEHTPQEWKAELNKQMEAHATILKEIPPTMWLGIVTVHCEEVRKQLSQKHKDVLTKLLDNYAKNTKSKCGEIASEFRKVENELKKECKDIAELVKMREYIDTLPGLVMALEPDIAKALGSFDLMEQFHYKLPKDLYRMKYTTFGWAKTVADKVADKEAELTTNKTEFQDEMRTKQEAFNNEMMEVEKKVATFGKFHDLSKAKKMAESVKDINTHLEDLAARSREFNENEMLFELVATDYRHLSSVQKDFEPFFQLWSTASDWMESYESWMKDPFLGLDGEAITNHMAEMVKVLVKVTKSKTIKEDEELAAVAGTVKKQMDEFQPILPLVSSLRHTGMRDRHWEDLAEKLPIKFELDEGLTLTRVIEEYKLQEHLEIIQSIGDTAAKEYQIESALDKMEAAWEGIEFEIVPYKETGTFVVKTTEEITALLDEHITTTQAVMFSAYKKPFEERIERWSARLNTANEVIDEWIQVQRQWLALVSIFTSPDIMKQLPSEGKKFSSVNKTWRMLMSQVHTNPDALAFTDTPNILSKFQDANALLNVVQKRLSDYLDQKRAAFARFFFLANEDLLQILSQTTVPEAVQPHLRKCFENICKLDFDKDSVIQALFSEEGERIEFEPGLDPKGKSVETWLGEVEDAMISNVRRIVTAGIKDYNEVPRSDWVRKWPGQAVLAGSQTWWTAQVEEALNTAGNEGVKKYYDAQVLQLSDMVALVRQDITDIQRKVLGALIVLDVHARDTVQKLVKANVSNVNDFDWICQMRYYQQESDETLWVQMVQSRYPYQYEYLGNTDRLVITPLTDRCYMTIMTALQLHLGGAPQGPAGTGKTETVKDLAKAVAKQCVVFNCSDGLDYLAMSKFFKGLASSGAWACFDEFNRIDIEVLSVVAQQVMTIWNAVKADVESFLFEDTQLKLNKYCSAFITMNPGYAGRTELPDNLAALFRPVAMMVPDYALIGEICLYSFGFDNARMLAQKMVATFQLSSEQLSAQDHYDYGMRAVKTVITRAGLLKRDDPDLDEASLMLRALRDVNMPKFLGQDLPLFEGIISDLFPNVEMPKIEYDELEAALAESCADLKLQPTPSFVHKCIQLYETTVVRHGLMLVGPTGGGKTSTIRTLELAMAKLNEQGVPGFYKVKKMSINPKSITQGQLYGESDINTHEWADGILANICREYIIDPNPQKKRQWAVLDGPVDAIWIENMNTVLDDNKKLCLVSGEILSLTQEMRMIFEVEDLEVASPATVSRCGMVYMEPTALGFAPVIKSWVDNTPDIFAPVREKLADMSAKLIEPSIEFVRTKCKETVPTVDNNLCASLFNLMDCMLAPFSPRPGKVDPEQDEQALANFLKQIEGVFLQSFIWSIGASVDTAGRALFNTFFRAQLAEHKMVEGPPDSAPVYDWTFDIENGKWMNWMKRCPAFEVSDRLSYSDIIVPTMDSVRYSYLMSLLLLNNKHTLLTGNTGTGKTVNAMAYLSRLPDSMMPITLMFSAATSANQTEDELFSKMSKRRAKVFGPPLGKRFVVFVDDMNMPARETYFAQPPIELLRQWMDHGGWYDRKALNFMDIVDCVYLGAMAPPGGGRNPVTPRFLRHFIQIAHTDLEDESMAKIFNTIVTARLAKFEEEIQVLSEKMVLSTMEVYKTVMAELLPTPAKSHYTFNLRDLSAVFQGILSASPADVQDAHTFIRLWSHECSRVFRDRLINDEDRQWLDTLLHDVMQAKMGHKWDDVRRGDETIFFGDYKGGMSAEKKVYCEIDSLMMAKKVMEDCLAEHNEENAPMKLVMFEDAIAHVSRVSRVLRQPGGNALLLGVGGSGRQSLTKLAVYMADVELFQVSVTKTYGMVEWREDIKGLLLSAGLKEQPTVFMFTDAQILNEEFFVDVNNILNSGEVPGIFASEDIDNIFMTCKIDCQRKNIPATKLNAYNEFLKRIRTNLHLVICMSPGSELFRTRLRMFPALINCCTIDWFSMWPQEALQSVANTALTEHDLQLPDVAGVVQVFEYIHQSVSTQSQVYAEELRRYNYVTPTSYLELLSTFKELLAEKREQVGGKRTKLQRGLDTLAAASVTVAKLQVDLTERQPVLIKTQAEVEAMKVDILKDQEDAAKTKVIVEKQEADANIKAEECKTIRDDAQADLDKAIPMLEAAVECLADLKKSDIDEVRNFKMPPSGVVLTMEATCIMLRGPLKFKLDTKADPDNMGKKIPDYWNTAQKHLLKNPKVLLDAFLNYDKDNIPDKVIKEIEPYVAREDFSVKKVESASLACRAICMWCHAMVSYNKVVKEVEPKRAMLKEAEGQLEVVMAALNEAKESMRAVEERLATLTENYNTAIAKANALQDEVALCEVKMERAHKLIGGLGGEKDRWTQTVADLTVAFESIVGDVLISAGTIAYLGAFTSNYRQALVSDWNKRLDALSIPHSAKCNLRTVMADPVAIRAWNIHGLPTDAVSTENGIVMSKSRRWPLMIDPQGQAGKFVVNMGNEKFPDGMTIVKLTDKNFLSVMENAIRFGRWVLVESVLEELDPALESLLLRQVLSINGQPHIKLGDTQVPYNDEFRLYFNTKLPNPHYAPELQVKVTLLNFTITKEGLQDQMLGTVVAKECPDVEEKKNALVVQGAKNKKALQDIEDNILRLLSQSKGDILDDEELINTLAASKKTSSEINEQVKEAEVVEVEIDAARSAYQPVAKRASILYFCIADLASMDPMYQYSLTWFVKLFIKAIADSPMPEDASDVPARLLSLNNFFTALLFNSVCRSLFDVHKTLFAFLLGVNLQSGDGLVDETEWRFLVAGAPAVKELPNPDPSWITPVVWNTILALTEMPAFEGLEAAFEGESGQQFKAYYEAVDPLATPLPAPWDAKLNTFQKLSILKTFRPEFMVAACRGYVAEAIGPEFNESPQFDLEKSYSNSNSVTPLVFVLSKGADPAAKLYSFADELNMRDKVNAISLGQGQGVIAERFIADAVKRGGWVLLQNCHLALSWLPTLEKICDDMVPEEIHDDFRLWLTSLPTPKFPVSILQNGVKMTNEPPAGLRANLTRSFGEFTDTELDDCQKPDEFKKLLFSLCFFHANLLERRKFGPLGWCIPYDFTEIDLQVCVTQLRDFINMYDEIPYKVIHFLAYDINYGGRVTDANDRITIRVILDDFMNPEVIKDGYNFSPSGQYQTVPAGNKEYYLKHINSMPVKTGPEVFGMHDNADISSAREDTAKMFTTILGLLPRSSSGGGKSREEIIADTVASIKDRVPAPFNIADIIKKYPTDYNESNNTVLAQEAIRYTRLLERIQKTLFELGKAVKGEMVMTAALDGMASAIFVNQVPEMWSAVAYPSLMPLAEWVQNLIERCKFLQTWIDDGIPNVFWFSGFFFPQAFLTGTLQNHARRAKKPIDSISFNFKVHPTPLADIDAKPETGVYVHGMYMEGARWDEAQGTIVDSRPKELYTPFPVMHLVPEEDRKPVTDGSVYRCPVYKVLTRQGQLSTTGHSTNFIMMMDVPTNVPDKKWVKAGAAMFCSLRY